MNRFIIVAGLVLFLTLSSSLPNEEKLKYSQKPTIALDDPQEPIIISGHRDTLSNDFLFEVKSKKNIPIHYFKHITTNVCFDNECRLLTITVYWSITGRYLGFELPKGEFLSKHDHEPFSNNEYKRLNDILYDGKQLGDLLKLYTKHSVNDLETYKA
ncbi:MAG: hypothetical protein GY705_04370 [Bacteroidetes bacterium]|nr:hypothetical protein [Bacteroidota bacterium]